MAGIDDIPRVKLIKDAEVGVGAITAAGAGALAMGRPMPAPAPAVPYIRLVEPGFVPEPPVNVPWKGPNIVRWGGVWGVAMSIPGDSSPAYLRELHRLSKHENQLQRELDLLKKQHADLQRETGQKWYWGSDELLRIGKKLATLDLKINRIELVIEWLQLQQDKINNNNEAFGPDSSRKFDTQYRLEEIEQELAAMDINGNPVDAKYRRRGGIKASASGDGVSLKTAETPKSDSKEWQEAAATGDVAKFVRAHDRRIQAIGAEVIRRIESRQSYLTISEWFETKVRPELAALNETSKQLSKTPLDGKLLHDARTRRTVLFIRVSPLLKQNRLSEAASVCNPPASSLEAQARRLKDAFGDRASFELKGLAGIHLAPHMDPDALAHILENLVTNAIEHPKHLGDKVHIVIEYNSGILFVSDGGAGMSEETLEGLREGKRIHNGVEVVQEDAESKGHGHGIGEVFKYAKLLAADLEFASEEGEGTTVSFTPLPGGFVPDAAEFILSERGNFDQLKMIVDQMSEANRLLLLSNLAKILFVFADEVLPELQQATDTDFRSANDSLPDLEPLRRRTHIVVERYTKYLNLVAAHGLEGMPSTLSCREVLRILTELLKNISKKEGPVLYL